MPSASERIATAENNGLRRRPRRARRRSPNAIMTFVLDGPRRPTVVLLFWRDFDDQAVAPAVFRVGQRLHGRGKLRLVRVFDDPRRGPEPLVAEADVDVRLRLDVLDPVGALAMLGDEVIVAVALGEPDLDFARKAGPAAGRGQVKKHRDRTNRIIIKFT